METDNTTASICLLFVCWCRQYIFCLPYRDISQNITRIDAKIRLESDSANVSQSIENQTGTSNCWKMCTSFYQIAVCTNAMNRLNNNYGEKIKYISELKDIRILAIINYFLTY